MGPWAALREELASRPPADSLLVDDETAAATFAVLRDIYDDAIHLVAPRVLARIESLVAAGGPEDQLITDAEWAALAARAEDALGDGVLDGVVAGASTFGKLPSIDQLVEAFLGVIRGLAGFGSQMRANLGDWIRNRIGEGITGDWGIGAVIEALRGQSPLSEDKADLVARSEAQAANNAGLYASLQAAPPAALRWVTRRDERVRPTHAAADKETVAYGELFMIGGHPARYPGDPDLPFELRVNCRCELAYVEGTEARRVVGSTKAELSAKAAALSIAGRSKMSKGELQHAVLKELCLQGRAGGPDCPDVFDQMNRTALLTLARSEGIVGRYRMTSEELVYSLRQTLRGGDTALIARGYAPRAEFRTAQRAASYKRGRVSAGTEFSTGNMPPVAARRAARPDLFAEFGGDKRGSVPCVHCGLRLNIDPAAGMAILVPEPIVPWSQGGTLALDNLLPSCPSCFRARGGRGIVAGAGFDPNQPRADDGKWTDTGGGTAVKDRPNLTTAEGLRAAFTIHGDGYSAIPSTITAGKIPHVQIDILDADGNKVGTAERYFRSAGTPPYGPGGIEAHHQTLTLDPSARGHGIATKFLADSVAMYEAAGITQVSVTATSFLGQTNGAYTWARLGFRLGGKNDRQSFGQSMKSITDNSPQDPTVNPKQDDITSWLTLADAVTAGKADMPDVLAHPIGKDFLLGRYVGTAWNGVMPVVKRDALTAAGPVELVTTATVDFDAWAECELDAPPLTASGGWEQVPRDSDGRWTDGPAGGPGDAHTTKVDDRFALQDAVVAELETIQPPDDNAFYDAQFKRQAAFTKNLDESGDQAAIDAHHQYVNQASEAVNAALVAGDVSAHQAIVDGLDNLLAGPLAEGAPRDLLRGMSGDNAAPKMGMAVGDTFTDPGFGSWTTEAMTAANYSVKAGSDRSVVLHLTNSEGLKSVPGTDYELETILPRGMRFEVTGVHDYVGPDGDRHRILRVRALDEKALTAAAFRGVDQVPRDDHGRWTDGPAGGRAPLPDVPFSDVHIAYRPRHPDGHADPGEIVWARIAFEEDKSQSKDRPVLIIGRTSDGKNLVGVQLTSKPKAGRPSIGSGAWDKDQRESFLNFDRFVQIDERNYRREGAYVKKPVFQGVIDELTKRRGVPRVELAFDPNQARDDHGQWTDIGGPGPTHTVTKVASAHEAVAQLGAATGRITSHHDEEWYQKRFDAQHDALPAEQAHVIDHYTLVGYREINAAAKGEALVRNAWDVRNATPYVVDADEQVRRMDGAMANAGTQVPEMLVRGKSTGPLRDLNYRVGDVYVERGFGSWTTSASTAHVFAGVIGEAPELDRGAVITRLSRTEGLKGILGEPTEAEWIVPRNTKYKVVAIHDFVGPGLGNIPLTFRMIDVEPDRGVAASAGFDPNQPRADDGKWTALRYGKTVPSERGRPPKEWVAPRSEFVAAQKLVHDKILNVPKPTPEKIARNLAALEKAKTRGRAGGELRGNSYTRRQRGEALFAEFGGDKRGYCPCGYCGLKVSPGGRGGYAAMQQDKILVAREGGDYGTPTNFPNLIPSCNGCNASRNDTPMVTRPKWDKRKPRALAASATPGMVIFAGAATARPAGWDNPDDLDDLDPTPVHGQLGHRTVDTDWGSYEQWIIGGIPVDPATVVRDGVVAGGGFDPNQPRDDHGRWTDGPGGTPLSNREMVHGYLAGTYTELEAYKFLSQHGHDDPLAYIEHIKSKQPKPPDPFQGGMQLDTASSQVLAANKAVLDSIDSGTPPSLFDLQEAEPATVRKYVAANVKSSHPVLSVGAKPDVTALRQAAMVVAEQHAKDLDLLKQLRPETIGLYKNAIDARRAMLRETGERKPTGGPSNPATHVVYGTNQIQSMSLDKVSALAAHHGIKPELIAESNIAQLRAVTIGAEADYQSNVKALLGQGIAPQHIPHSRKATDKMLKGIIPVDLLGGAPASTSSVVNNSPGPLGKPADWNSWGPGKKAAWTKKANLASKGLGPMPHVAPATTTVGEATVVAPGPAPGPFIPAVKPADWNSWGPGKKAAWTKKANLAAKGLSGSTITQVPGTAKPSGPLKAGKALPGGVVVGEHKVEDFESTYAARKAWLAINQKNGTNTGAMAHNERRKHAKANMTSEQQAAWDSYQGGGYSAMNRCHKYGEGCSEQVKKKIANLVAAFNSNALTPAPKLLMRGKTQGPMKDLEYKVGDTYNEPSFGSWSTSAKTAKSFASATHAHRSVITRLVDSKGKLSLPGTQFEYETIMPPNTKYRVVAIHDVTSAATSKYGLAPQKMHLRTVYVEVVE